MTCMEAQALITPFINDKLDIATLEQFIDHVENCKDCKEELEVYYALLTAMKQLDEEEEVSADFAKELENKLKESQEKILRAKLLHIRKRILFFVIVISLGLFTSVSVSVVEEALNMSKETKFNTTVVKNEVLAPYMNNPILDNMITYQQLQADLARIEEEKKQKEAQEEEEARIRLQEQREKERLAAILHAQEAKEEEYNLYGPYSRRYEEASKLMQYRYDAIRNMTEQQDIPMDSPMEYSR